MKQGSGFTFTNVLMLVIGILLLLSAWTRKGFTDMLHELQQTGTVSVSPNPVTTAANTPQNMPSGTPGGTPSGSSTTPRKDPYWNAQPVPSSGSKYDPSKEM